jgi:glyoxylase-like metal-dependent hydrolase (beta-lactamase superfamily II)
MEQALDSLSKIAELKYEILLPGHGEPILKNASAIVGNWINSGLKEI